MRQSNGYIILFSIALTIACGGLLAGIYSGLKSTISSAKANDKRSQILNAYEKVPEGKDLQKLYDEKIVSYVVNVNGEVLNAEGKVWSGKDDDETMDAFDVDIKKESSKPNPEDKLLPVYCYRSSVDPSRFDAYIVPVYGNGLWDKIWGYIAIEDDFSTIKGVVFDHLAETPGLGARITESSKDVGESEVAFQSRFVGKQIYGVDGEEVVSVKVLKGEKNTEIDKYHEVDGLSGSSMTTNGVNSMLSKYFKFYDAYFQSQKKMLATAEGSSGNATTDIRNLMD